MRQFYVRPRFAARRTIVSSSREQGLAPDAVPASGRRAARPARRGRLLAVVLGTVAAVASAFSLAGLAAAGEGTLVKAGTVLNYFDTTGALTGGQRWETTETSVVADPANHLLFEVNNFAGCPTLVSMDIDTYAVLATNGRTSGGVCQPTATFDRPAGSGGAQPFTVVADSTDGVLIAATSLQNAITGNTLALLSERTLDKLAEWTIPTTQNFTETYITGVSWYAPLDEMIVVSSHGDTGSGKVVPPGVAVTAFNVKQSLAQGKLVQNWQLTDSQLNTCTYSLVPFFGTAGAYHGSRDNAVFVPCQIQPVSVGVPQQSDGVVRVPLTNQGCGGGTPECFAGKLESAVAPGQTADVFFDSAIDRAFMPMNTTTNVSALIYDGKDGQFEGQAALSDISECPSTAGFGTEFGLDPSTGRIYAITHTGLHTIDGRATPLSPGDVFPDFAADVPPGSTTVLPPDLRYSYSRVLVSDVKNYCDSTTEYQHDFQIFADSRPASATGNETPNDDQATYQGAVPNGAALSVATYGATARGYGAHLDWVSSADGAAENAIGNEQVSGVPYGGGNRDLLMGDVNQLSLSDGSAQGSATAVGDGNGSTAEEYATCSNATAALNCATPPQPPCDVFIFLNQPCPSTGSLPAAPQPSGAPAPPKTTQLWASPLASCSYPGAGSSSAHYDGLYLTSYSQPKATADDPNPSPVPSQSQASGTDAIAHADVNCVGNPAQANAITASAFARGLDNGFGMGITIASATTTTSVTPPDPTTNIAGSTVTSTTKGLVLTAANGAEVRIGEIVQTATTQAGGVPGSAKVARAVTMTDATVNGTPLCTSPCDVQSVIDAINGEFPYLVHAWQPDPAIPYQADGNGLPNGSPGGYKAVLESNPTELYGDEQFNGMLPEEASQLPALRLVVYGYKDGAPNESRLVIDLAGVESDTEVGVQPAGAVAVDQPPVNPVQAAVDAGVPPAQANGYLPTVPPPPAVQVESVPGGPLGYVVRAFHGLDWLMRSPLAAVQMAAFLGLLGLPLLMMRRRGATDGEIA